MSTLEEIKARAEEAAAARLNYAGESEGEGIMLALMAEQSSYDVPPLIAALEAVCLLADDAVTTLRRGGGGLALADDINAAIGKALA